MTNPKKESKADPFDNLESFKLSQDFAQELGVTKLLTRVPVKKPNKQEFIRVRPEPEFQLDTAVIELKEDREIYVLDPEIRHQLPGEWAAVRLYTTINRQGILFLWPCKLPGPEGRSNPWHETALEAAALAQDSWIKVVADMSFGGYLIYQAQAELPEPIWPDHTFNKLLKIAFKDHFISSLDHPVIRRLLGHE